MSQLSLFPDWLTGLLNDLSRQHAALQPSADDQLQLAKLLQLHPELREANQKEVLAHAVLAILSRGRAHREAILPLVDRWSNYSLSLNGPTTVGGQTTHVPKWGWWFWPFAAATPLILLVAVWPILIKEPPPKLKNSPKKPPVSIATSTSASGSRTITDYWLMPGPRTSTSTVTTLRTSTHTSQASIPLTDIFFVVFGTLCWWYAAFLFVQLRVEEKQQLLRDEERLEEVDENALSHPQVAYGLVSRYPPPEEDFAHSLDILKTLGLTQSVGQIDAEATVDAVIAAGGRWQPVWRTQYNPSTLTILLDSEGRGTSVWLPRFRAWLRAWAKAGIDILVYEFDEHPDKNLRRFDPQSLALGEYTELAQITRESSGPLLIFSRYLRVDDRKGHSSWVGQTRRFGPKVWLNPNPRASLRGRDVRRLKRLGWGCFSGGTKALLTALQYLAGHSVAVAPTMWPDTGQPEIQKALKHWAWAVALVPDPDWDLVESIRQHPDIDRVLPKPEYVQLLLEYFHAEGEKQWSGRGPKLVVGAKNYRDWVIKLTRDAYPLMLDCRRCIMAHIEEEAAPNLRAQLLKELNVCKQQYILEPASDAYARLKTLLDDPAIRAEAIQVIEDICAYARVTPKIYTQMQPSGLLRRNIYRKKPWENIDWSRLLPIRGLWLVAACAVVGACWGLAQLTSAREIWWGPVQTMVQGRVMPSLQVAARELMSLAATDFRPEMHPIPSGVFGMGSPVDEPGRYDAREVLQTVEIDEPFWLAATEVTQSQWVAVMGENPSGFRGPNHPVEQVSVWDALVYLNRLSEKEGLSTCYDLSPCTGQVMDDLTCPIAVLDRASGCLGYRLPTEEEWEYAARGGTSTAIYTGDITINDDESPEVDAIAWYRRNSEGRSHPVGGKGANPYGLYDVIGNVWEWTESRGRRGLSGDATVDRGCSWGNDAQYCRAAIRRADSPGIRYDFLGFRPARSVP